MEIKDIFEMILSDQVLEGIGFVLCIGFLWGFFFSDMNQLIDLFGTALFG